MFIHGKRRRARPHRPRGRFRSIATTSATAHHAASPTTTPSPAAPRLEPLEARTLLSAVPFGADSRDNSEFMIGDIFVNVVLFESDGSIDPNQEDWTAAEISSVKSEIAEGAQWWRDTLAAQFPNAPHTLNFTFDFTHADNPIATGYEPITQSSEDEALWIDAFLDTVGYNSGNSIFSDLDRYNHDQRVDHETHWAFTTFVVDSTVDDNGRFADGFGSYAYHGGPFMMLTLDNQGWGLDRMGHMFAHELGHIFYALDEYPGVDSYFEHSGYHNTQNLNAADDHPDPDSRVASIMAEASLLTEAWNNHTSSPTSFEMIGWKDSDGDGLFDVLDVPLTLTGSGALDADTGLYTFDGNSRVNTLPNENPQGAGHDITINTVDALQYRIDGGAWTDAAAPGGYDVAVHAAVDLSGLTGGEHTIEWRTVDQNTGVASNVVSEQIDVAAQPVTVVVNGGEAQRSTVTSLALTLNAPPSVTDLALTNLTTGQAIDAAHMAVDYDAGTQTATWNFPGLTGGSLADGVYSLQAGTDAAFTIKPLSLHRLFGDTDGDRDVDALDLFAFRQTFQKLSTDPAYNPALDDDADGDVDFLDLTRFRVNLQTVLEEPVAELAGASQDAAASSTHLESEPEPNQSTGPASPETRRYLAAWAAQRSHEGSALARAKVLRGFQVNTDGDADERGERVRLLKLRD